PAPASTCAASAPNAPVAPVTIAVLPLTSNNDSGFFRKSSGISYSSVSRHPEVAANGSGPAGPMTSSAALDGCIRDIVGHSSRLVEFTIGPATSPGSVGSHLAVTSGLFHRRHGDCDCANFIASIDDLARFVGTDIAAVTRFHDHLLATGNDCEFAGQHVVDFLGRRSIGTSAAARKEVGNTEDQGLGTAHLGAEHPQRFVVAVIRRFVGLGLR